MRFYLGVMTWKLGRCAAKSDICVFRKLRAPDARRGKDRLPPVTAPAECSRAASTRVGTRGSPAPSAVSHSAPGGSVSALSVPPAPGPPPGSWAVSAASGAAALATQCFGATAAGHAVVGSGSGEPAAGAEPDLYTGPSPRFVPQPSGAG